MPRRRAIPPSPPAIDREKLRAYARKLGDEYIFYMLDDAIELMTLEQLALLSAKYVRPDELRPDPIVRLPRSLPDHVRDFDARSRASEYYEDFNVNSRNCTQLSGGTRAFTADFLRLVERCVLASRATPNPETAAAFAVLFDLLRHIDECCDDVVFFADEAGAWQIPVHWPEVFPAWFRSLATAAGPTEYAEQVVVTIEEFEHYNWDRNIEAALAAASSEQRDALTARAALPRRRR